MGGGSEPVQERGAHAGGSGDWGTAASVLGRGTLLPAALEPKVPLAADEEPVPEADDECSEDQTAVGQQQQQQ
jgi:hypothetical protein